jgi:GH18 family chitinase
MPQSRLDPSVMQTLIQQALGEMTPQASHVTVAQPETTSLSPAENDAFQQWVRDSGIRDLDHPLSLYDYRGLWKDAGGPDAPLYDPKKHGTDRYKQHGHMTFSNESKYAPPNDPRAGRWEGDVYITPDGRRFNMADKTVEAAFRRNWEAQRQ